MNQTSNNLNKDSNINKKNTNSNKSTNNVVNKEEVHFYANSFLKNNSPANIQKIKNATGSSYSNIMNIIKTYLSEDCSHISVKIEGKHVKLTCYTKIGEKEVGFEVPWKISYINVKSLKNNNGKVNLSFLKSDVSNEKNISVPFDKINYKLNQISMLIDKMKNIKKEDIEEHSIKGFTKSDYELLVLLVLGTNLRGESNKVYAAQKKNLYERIKYFLSIWSKKFNKPIKSSNKKSNGLPNKKQQHSNKQKNNEKNNQKNKNNKNSNGNLKENEELLENISENSNQIEEDINNLEEVNNAEQNINENKVINNSTNNKNNPNQTGGQNNNNKPINNVSSSRNNSINNNSSDNNNSSENNNSSGNSIVSNNNSNIKNNNSSNINSNNELTVQNNKTKNNKTPNNKKNNSKNSPTSKQLNENKQLNSLINMGSSLFKENEILIPKDIYIELHYYNREVVMNLFTVYENGDYVLTPIEHFSYENLKNNYVFPKNNKKNNTINKSNNNHKSNNNKKSNNNNQKSNNNNQKTDNK